MARPKLEHPTPAELEVLQVIWQSGPCSVRQVMEALDSTRRGRAYTSVMSLLNLMHEKGLVKRRADGRAFVYQARVNREKTLGQLIGDLCRRAFANSASSLVEHMLDETTPSRDELRAIRAAIETYRQKERRP